ncbi:MAG: ATP synthase subunit C [Nitrososphaeria archaeon]
MKHLKHILGIIFLCSIAILCNGAQAQGTSSAAPSFKEIGAAIAFSIAAAGAAVGMGQIGSTGISVLAEKPEMLSKVLMFLLFVEAIAIYGLVLAFLILLG